MTEDKDVFGLPKMSTNQEVAVSFTLFVLGMILVGTFVFSMSSYVDIGPAFLGLLMLTTSYFFAIESIRELEEKDHFLANRLMKRKE